MTLSAKKLDAILEGGTSRVLTGADADTAGPGSQQLDDDFQEDYLASAESKRAVRPPMTPRVWLRVYQESTRLRRAIRLTANNAVGLGYTIEPKDPVEGEDGKVLPETADEIGRTQSWWENANPDMPVLEVAMNEVADKVLSGNGYLELTRTWVGDMPLHLYHLPTEHMRVLASGDGFVQARTGYNGAFRRRYFKRFGDARLMDKNTAALGTWEQIARDDRASEVIHCREYDTSLGGSGTWYGQPGWAPAYDAAKADNKVAQRQRAAVERSPGWANFFSIVNGGLDPKEYAEIKESIKNVSFGFRTVGRPLVFNPKKADGRRNADTRVTAQSLGSGLPETTDILALRKDLREEIREGVGPSSIFLGAAGELSRASAAVSQRITVEQEWLPLLRSEEWRFNQVHRALGATRTAFRFARPRVTDDYQDSQILARLGVPSALTINQLLRLANRMVPGAHFATHINKWWADIPVVVLRTLLAIKGLGGPDADAGKLMDELLTLVEASAP